MEPLARPLILVVDDEEDFRGTMCHLLDVSGYQTMEAADGAAALAAARARRPSLILLDLMMPGMNGWQFLAAQRADPALAGVPVIVLTAALDPVVVDGPAVMSKMSSLDVILRAIRSRLP